MLDDHYTFRAHIVGTTGSLTLHDFLSPTRDNRLSITTASDTRVKEVTRRSTYTFQLEAFAAALRDGTSLPIDLDDAVTNMAYIDDAYRAAGLEPR